MSFLFGKKKGGPQPSAPAPRDGRPPGGPNNTAPPVNGNRDPEKTPLLPQKPVGPTGPNGHGTVPAGTKSVSPEHGSRGGSQQDNHSPQQGPRPPLNGPISNAPPADKLYPWSQRRLTFTTSQPNPFPRYGATVNATSSKEGEIYLMGGLVNGSMVKSDLWMIEAGGGNLACYPIGTTSEGPGPRVGHASLLVGNAFIVFGGDTKNEEIDDLDDTLYLLNTSTRQWSRALPPGPRPAGRYGHTLNILGSKIYVFGGQVEGHFFNDLIAFDLNALQNANNRWELLIPDSIDGGPEHGPIPPGRTNHSVVSYNEKLYLFGGTDGTVWFNDVWSYDPRHNGWTQLDCIGYIPAPREGHSAAIVNDVMYVFGGRTEEGNDLGDLAAFRITSRRWYTFQNMGQSPSPRSGHRMTAYGKQVVVIAGEPSSAPIDVAELSYVYILDTTKIKYPNDQQIQQTPTGERVVANRRPSGEKTALPQSKGMLARDATNAPPPNRSVEAPRIMFSGGSRESMGAGPGPGSGPGPGQGREITNPQNLNQSIQPGTQAPGSRLPRAAPPGQASNQLAHQQFPAPRTNGVTSPPGAATRPPPGTDDRALEPPGEATRGASLESDDSSRPMYNPPQIMQNRAMSPLANGSQNVVVNGRGTPSQQQARAAPMLSVEENNVDQGRRSLSSEEARQPPSIRSVEAAAPIFSKSIPSHVQNDGGDDHSMSDRSATRGIDPAHAARNENYTREIESANNRIAWLESELNLARGAGYKQSAKRLSFMGDDPTNAFDNDDKSLIEALIAMRQELADVQGNVEASAQETAQRILEAERQRDAAIREAAYAKAKLAAHGGSPSGSPQLDDFSRDFNGSDRSIDLSRKLGQALTTQSELQLKVESLTTELESERRAREVAEDDAEAALRNAATMDQSHTLGELEGLRANLHEVEKNSRQVARERSELHARAKLLEVDKDDLSQRLSNATNTSQTHLTALEALRGTMAISHDKLAYLEAKLERERERREGLEAKIVQLRSDHEERTSELENMTRKHDDARELLEMHSREAQSHRLAIVSGLDQLKAREMNDSKNEGDEKRMAVLNQQVADAKELVRNHEGLVDEASGKLLEAESRRSGLEDLSQKASRENINFRKQKKESETLLADLRKEHKLALQQLESHQRDASALAVQHGALKELLNERSPSAAGRGGSRNQDRMPGRLDTPDNDHVVRDLEQQIADMRRTHSESKSEFDTKLEETERDYRGKLEQLEQDYQSAVHYVKGTEKMLKRMKDELGRYKGQNAELKAELDSSQRSTPKGEADASAWEQERQSLRREIEDMQASVRASEARLESQMQNLQSELQAAHGDRDRFRDINDQTQKQLDHLRGENIRLEARATDAEQKVSMLLDQVETSVDNYRRQSQSMSNSSGHARNASSTSTLNPHGGGGGHSHNTSLGADSAFSVADPNNRNSMALDSLASELETLRTQWEGTHRTYRLSSQFDFERTPNSTTGGELSDSLASWRKRLDAEEAEKESSRSPKLTPTGGYANGRMASPRGGFPRGAGSAGPEDNVI